MAIDLREYEAAPRHDGDYATRLAALQKRLARAQIAAIVHRRRAMIVVEGWDASGRGGVVQRLAAALDPRAARVFAIAAPTPCEAARHPMARFWARVPAAGRLHLFDGSWYGRLLGERIEGAAGRAARRRAADEINEFEAQQVDAGTTLVKLFLHVTVEEQAARLRARLAHPWKRWKVTPAQLHDAARRDERLAALREMFLLTDTRWAPWRVIDAGSRKYARLAALEHVAQALERAMPAAPPPADPALVAAARAFGVEV